MLVTTSLVAACSGDVGDQPGAAGSDSPSVPMAAGTVPSTVGAIDPVTGQPITPIDPITGQPITPIDPATGEPSVDPVTGQPVPAGTDTAVVPSGAPTDPPTATGCVMGVPPVTSQVTRLTNAQYNRTVQDLLKVSAPGLLATEQEGDITTSIWAGYQASADAIAAEVMGDPALVGNFMPCTPTGDGAECLNQTIVEFGRRAYRRPLSEAEVADFQTLIAKRAEITPTGAAEEVAEVILAAFLQSPSFLQRAEITETADGSGNFTLSSHEVAARLSYMLWGTMPDPELSTAADMNQLGTKEQVLAQAERMVLDEKAKEIAAEFHREYLHLTVGSRWDSVRKDAMLFPQFTDQVVPDMIMETESLFDEVFTSGGSFQDLLTTNVGYVTAATAPLYGMNAQDYGATPERVEFTSGERPGFLTRVGFLAAYSSQTRTNPILRGAFVTKEVLGLSVGMPDPNATMTELPMRADLDTNRKRVAEMTANEPCSTCHTPLVNPPGFVLEAFDSTGKTQTTERDTDAPIDTVADVLFDPEAGPESVSTAAEMMTKIAGSASAQRFYAARWVGYAFARELTASDHCTADRLGAANAAPDYSIQDLLVDLTQSDYFMTRAAEVTQ
jgi:hypothetical protein